MTILFIAIFCFSSFYNCGCKLCWNSERLLCLFWFRLGRYEHVPHNRRVVCKLSPHSLTTICIIYIQDKHMFWLVGKFFWGKYITATLAKQGISKKIMNLHNTCTKAFLWKCYVVSARSDFWPCMFSAWKTTLAFQLLCNTELTLSNAPWQKSIIMCYYLSLYYCFK